MPLDKFEAFNREQEAAGRRTYANPRNTAAGSLRVLDPTITAARPLSLFCYQVVEMDGGPELRSQWAALDYLREMGFPVSDQSRRFDDFEQVVEHVAAWREERSKLNFEADGLVIKIDDFATQERLGVVGNAPRSMIAYKYPAAEAVTRLKRIVVNVGRTGTLNPLAELEPVRIGGVTVSHATLHNADYVAEQDIREGDTVTVKRAGEVIPQVLGPVLELRPADAQPWRMPERCPACGEPVERVEGEVAYYCVNAACPAQLVRSVEHFVSKGAMDIEGFGIRQAELFVEKGLIHDVADIYYLTAEPLLEMEGFAEKKVSNLLAAIEASKQRPPDRLLAALGIQGIGGVNAQTLMDHFRSLEALATATPDELRQVPGVGPKLAESIAGWFSHEPNRRLVDKLQGGRGVHQGGCGPAGRDAGVAGFDLCHHRHAAVAEPRAGHGADPGARRKGDGLGKRQHRLRGGRREGRQQAGQGAQAGGEGDRRGGAQADGRWISTSTWWAWGTAPTTSWPSCHGCPSSTMCR